jgi:hypothetical protein
MTVGKMANRNSNLKFMKIFSENLDGFKILLVAGYLLIYLSFLPIAICLLPFCLLPIAYPAYCFLPIAYFTLIRNINSKE